MKMPKNNEIRDKYETRTNFCKRFFFPQNISKSASNSPRAIILKNTTKTANKMLKPLFNTALEVSMLKMLKKWYRMFEKKCQIRKTAKKCCKFLGSTFYRLISSKRKNLRFSPISLFFFLSSCLSFFLSP